MSKIKLSNFAPEAPVIHERTICDTDFQITDSIPYEDLLQHIQWAIILITDSNGYISEPVKVACQEIVLCAAFTNLDFSSIEQASVEQHELYEIYDIIKKTGIVAAVKTVINQEQLSFYENTLNATLISIFNYRNSVAGMVELLSNQGADIKANLTNILADFDDPEKMENVIKMADLINSQNK